MVNRSRTELLPVSEPGTRLRVWSLSGTRLTGGRRGAQREAQAEDCLSAKPASVAGVREH